MDRQSFLRLPKAERHVHLEGSFQVDTALALAAQQNDHPWCGLNVQQLKSHVAGARTFTAFLEVFIQGYRLLRTARDYQVVMEDLLTRFETEGVIAAEVLYSPGVACQNLGVSIRDIHDGIQHALRHSQIPVSMVLDTVLNLGPEFMGRTLALTLADRRDFLRGFSVGGGDASLSMVPFLPLFEKAQQSGLYCVAHAGEVDGTANIWTLLQHTDLLHIAHGCAAAEDPALLRALALRGISIDVCLTSNLCTGVVDTLTSHPVHAFIAYDVPFSLSTDDPFYFNTDLYHEYQLFSQLTEPAQVERIALNSLELSPKIGPQIGGQ